MQEIVEIDLSKQKQDKKLGYMYVYDPTHPMASKSGKVYCHRYIMAKHLGRFLEAHEVIHHIDHDKKNNQIDNLELTTHSKHAQKHAVERYIKPEVKVYKCENCGKVVDACQRKNGKLFYSVECSKNSYKINIVNNKVECTPKKKFDPTFEELQNLIWSMPATEVAKIFRVSDKAIEKRCKKLGINKPPRGYWAKKYAAVTNV